MSPERGVRHRKVPLPAGLPGVDVAGLHREGGQEAERVRMLLPQHLGHLEAVHQESLASHVGLLRGVEDLKTGGFFY